MICCGYLLELSPRGNSNRSPQHMILWRNFHFLSFNTNPRFPPFLLYVRCKSGITFVRRCFCDEEKHLIANKPLYMAFVYLETKAFDCVHQDFIWLAMPTLGTEKWLVHLVQSTYKDFRSRVRVGDGYCQ